MTRMRLVTVPDMQPDDWVAVEPGTALLALFPAVHGPVVLRLNGDYLLRAMWPDLVGDDDLVEWLVDQPGDKEDFRVILQVAAVVASIWFPAAAPYLAAAAVAYNLLVPPTVLRQPENDAKAVYNASLAGNQARLDQPVWRVCGIDKINPPFAAQPYYEFDSNNDQFYYVVLAIGFGPYDILAEFIGKTPLGSFSDVVTHQYLKPGVLPSTAKANVFTSSEVTGLELKTGIYVGGFIACQPGRLVESIGWDVVAPQGLGKPATEEDDDTTVTVQWRVEYCPVNDAGAEIGAWRTLATEERTLSTNTVQRWSGKQTLDVPCRPKVRMARSNPKNTDANARDGIEWAGLRAYMVDPAPLNPNVSHYEIVLRASQQLSAQSQTDFNLILQGKCRTWTPDDGWSCELGDYDNYTATRNPAWWLADLWSDPVWGEGLPDSRIDLQSLYDLSRTWTDRQDRFDYTFSSRTDAWAAGQLIASAGRARMFRRYGVRTLARDELATLGASAITPRMVVEGSSMPVSEKLPREIDPDGVIVEYLSNRTWDIDVIECPCPGVVSMERPVYQKYEGIKGRTHALREGLYHAADMALRSRVVSAKTEMQALVSAFMLPLRWMPEIMGYGQTGDVAFWDAGTLTMGLTEKADFSRGPTYLTLRRDDGSITDPVLVLPGPTPHDVVLPAAPDFDLVLDDGLRERPVFLLGTVQGDELVKISSIKDGGQSKKGAQYYDIEAVVDDPIVHTVDNPYLPGPGDDQDPIGLPGDVTGGGTLLLVTLSNRGIADGSFLGGGGAGAGITLRNDGTLGITEVSNGDPPDVPNEWMLLPVEVAQAGEYEVFASATASPGIFGPVDVNTDIAGSALNTWLSLDTTRSWSISATPGVPMDGTVITLRQQNRQIASGVIQVDRNILMVVYSSGNG